jgi:hypothetical protein
MSTMTVSAGLGTGLGARPTAPRAARGAVRPAARLTRRGRLLVSLLLLAVAVTAAVLLGGGAPALAGTDRPVAHERVTVLPGQTLWQIAEQVAPGSDPRETVQRILDLNGLQTSQVEAGTALLLP